MKITVVTVTYNCEKEVEKTIQSVLSQTYPDIEYIIVDGASKDGTLDVVTKYEDRISKIVSEPDHGVYDAMNKAAKLATGEWVNFMNAGDCFVSNDTISLLFEQNHSNAGVVFGDTISVKGCSSELVRYNPKWWRHKYMPSCHQSIFVRREILQKYPFDPKYKIAADLDSFKRMKDNNVVFDYVPIIVAKYDSSGGISQNPDGYYRELYHIIYNWPLSHLAYGLFKMKFICRKILRGGGIFLKGSYRLLRFIGSFYQKREFPYAHPTAQVPVSTHIYNCDNLILGERVSLGPNSEIMNPRAKFIMKKWSFTARELLVVDGNHMSIVGMPLIDVRDEDKDRLDVNHEFNKDIVVDEDVWIGARVTLCAGCHISRGAIVAAGAVVTKEMPPYSVCGGVPAKFIKFKWTIEEILEHEAKLYPKEERYTFEQLQSIFSQYIR